MAVLTASAYRPLVQCQPSISEAFEQLSQFSVINGRLWWAAEFGRCCRGELWNFRKLARRIWQNFLRENCGP